MMTVSMPTRAAALDALTQARAGRLGRWTVLRVLTEPRLVYGLRWEFDIEVAP